MPTSEAPRSLGGAASTVKHAAGGIGEARTAAPGRSRRLPAIAAVTSSEACSDSDDSDTSPAPAASAAAALAASAPSPRRRSPRIYCYTGDRAQDEAETNRRLRHGLPNGAGAFRALFAFGSCPLHDQADLEYLRVNPYRA